MNESSIWRRQTFDDIKARLASPRPGLIAIAGPAGSGRTHLLRCLAAAAKELGYRVLLGTDAEPLAIEPSTTVDDVRRRLQALVTEEAQPQSGWQPMRLPPTPAARRRGIGWATSRLDTDRKIMGLLSQLSPLLVAVDGFQPSRTFGLWFTRVLTPRLRASGNRVAIVITDRASALRSVTEVADFPVTLGPLNADEVRNHLIAASSGLTPELTSRELDQYVAAAVAEPAVMSALSAVFEACSRARAEVTL